MNHNSHIVPGTMSKTFAESEPRKLFSLHDTKQDYDEAMQLKQGAPLCWTRVFMTKYNIFAEIKNPFHMRCITFTFANNTDSIATSCCASLCKKSVNPCTVLTLTQGIIWVIIIIIMHKNPLHILGIS